MNKVRLQTGFLIAIVFFVALSRVFPHISNFSPIAAIGLFGAAHFYKKWQAFLIPILALWISDLLLNNTVFSYYHAGFVWFYKGFLWQYFAYILIIFMGILLYKKNISIVKVLIGAITSSVLFFIVSNFGVWVSSLGGMYPKTLEGLTACYIAALPFLRGTLMSDLLYSAILFGGYYLLQRKYSFFRLAYLRY